MEVRFFTGVEQPLAFAARVLRKKYREGERVAVLAPPAVLARLDQLLWTDPPLDFLPHLRLRAGEAVPADAALTRLWLLEQPVPAVACDSVLNLGFQDVAALGSYGRIADIVSLDPEERAAGQQRWRSYKAAGAELHHHPQNAGA